MSLNSETEAPKPCSPTRTYTLKQVGHAPIQQHHLQPTCKEECLEAAKGNHSICEDCSVDRCNGLQPHDEFATLAEEQSKSGNIRNS